MRHDVRAISRHESPGRFTIGAERPPAHDVLVAETVTMPARRLVDGATW